MRDSNPVQHGVVYLVGAGPGDPGLITLRGVECLRRADLVLYDYLVNPRLLTHARPEAELLCLGRHGQDRLMPQAEVNQRMVAAARAGHSVVRLKGGDPAVFARAAEETAALEAAGVPYVIVPGVTAALAVAGYTGIPLTHRDAASAVALVTGHEGDDKTGAPLDYRRLAGFPGTLVFYMGVTTARHWSAELIAGGQSPKTPAAIVRRCSWPDQTIMRCTLEQVADRLEETRLRPPVVVIVGPSVELAADVNWFTARPLFGLRVLVTRPAGQLAALREHLEELGAEVLEQPAIEIVAPDDWAPVDDALDRIDQFDWLVFSSANGVRALIERLCRHGGDLRRLERIRLAAIGPGTANELSLYRLTPDLEPDEFRAEALAAALSHQAAGRRFLLARASRGREVLAEQLRAAGGHVEQIVVYASRDVARADPEIVARLAAGRIDWITVTSSAIARSLAALFGEALHQAKLASISPITSATLRELGHEPAAEATRYTMRGVAEAIARAHQSA
jgi:uroporphyrinogen III methyltransferase/synthase